MEGFALKPAESGTKFVPVPKGMDLDAVLSVRGERTTDKCGAFSFMNVRFQIEAKKNQKIANKKITFIYSNKNGFVAEIDKKLCPARPIAFLGRGNLPNVLVKTYQENAKNKNFKEIA